MITLLLSTGGFWILPVLVFGCGSYTNPPHVMWRDYFAALRHRVFGAGEFA